MKTVGVARGGSLMLFDVTPTSKRLRIACFAYAVKEAGSGSTALFHILHLLLVRGHEIDFFNKANFVYPRELLAFPNFRYVDCRNTRSERINDIICKVVPGPGRTLSNQVQHAFFSRLVVKRMREQQRLGRRYDLQLYMGREGNGRIAGVPTVSWVQGPPLTDARSIRKFRTQIIDLCGLRQYLLLRAFAIARSTLAFPKFGRTDFFIVGSAWSADALASFSVPRDRIMSVAYPIDLGSLTPGSVRPLPDVPTILWLGRTVPRKRLDLFLDACALLIERGQNVRVKVVGGFAFVPGYRKLLDRFKYPASLTYIPRAGRDEIPQLLRDSDVILQTSENEDYASTPLEALCCGVPVVLGTSNGSAEYAGGAIEIFTESTPASVADAVQRMFKRLRADPAGVAAAARQAAEANLRLEPIVDRLEATLQRIAARTPSPLVETADA